MEVLVKMRLPILVGAGLYSSLSHYYFRYTLDGSQWRTVKYAGPPTENDIWSLCRWF